MLSPETVVKILVDREKGSTYENLAFRYKVTYRTVYTICTGQTRLAQRALKLIQVAKKQRKSTASVLTTMRKEHAAKRRAA